MKEYWTSLASLLGVFAFFQTLLQTVFPPELRFASVKLFNRIFNWFSSYCYFDITEIDGVNTNELYNAVQLYLSSSVSITGSRLSLTRALNSSAFTFGLSNNDCIIDTFNGVNVLWEHVVIQRQAQTFSWRPLPDEKRGFTLRIKKKDKSLILDSYLDYIMEKANDIRRKNQDRLLYTNSRGGSLDARGHPWESVPFKHPSTFDTLAMDPEKKTEIMEDLQDFANGQTFYQTTGRAWKRGYLLYGPPELRKLLMKTSSKSIIVIEDIDCSVNLTNRKKTNNPGSRNYYDSGAPEMRGGCGSASGEDGGNSITLSGLLNFTDGLWSCCGSERIFVFTTNHIEKLDPALLRSGRMDMHIFMSYCSFPALKILLKNYLGFEETDLDDSILKELEEVIHKAEMTPADISEVLIKNRRNKGKAVSELLEVLKIKAETNEKNGGLREKNGDDVEEEEQEKRALENPKQEFEFEENLKKEEDEEKIK
ncbi:AAA-ATPase [Quillaja saponaria]|uniref:AAA-ATPase n=1 Tax=Quillaja saponaria TaxID=32244 RepID=A0AAD7QDK9_QUISA|nr:AAA-ATPase [Quillaja saponaria]